MKTTHVSTKSSYTNTISFLHNSADISPMRKSLITAALALAAMGSAFAQGNQTQKLASGVEVTHITKGTGAQAKPTSHVEVHYEGTFKDGKIFDSSRQRGQTITFPLTGVIKCWTEGVSQMQEGGRAKLFCPSETAYGSRGAGSAVPPNTDLYFDVELIKVVR